MPTFCQRAADGAAAQVSLRQLYLELAMSSATAEHALKSPLKPGA